MKDDREHGESKQKETLGFASPGGLAVLEKESGPAAGTAPLERRHGEPRLRAELRIAADRILAIPLHDFTRDGP
jgi:hypothetical protein